MIENYDASHETIFKRQEKKKFENLDLSQYIQEDAKSSIDKKKFHELEKSFDKYYDIKKTINEILDF